MLKIGNKNVKVASNNVFDSKDILTIIAGYINHPQFKKTDWNSFVRICKKTSVIGEKCKIIKAKTFGVDINEFEKDRIIIDGIKQIKNIQSSHLDKKYKQGMNHFLWKFRWSSSIHKVINNKQYYFNLRHLFVSSEALYYCVENIILKDIVEMVNGKEFNLIVNDNTKNWDMIVGNVLSKYNINPTLPTRYGSVSTVCIPYVKSKSDIVIFIDCTDQTYYKGGYGRLLNIIVYNSTEFRKEIVNRIVTCSKKNRKYRIMNFTTSERSIVYDFIIKNQLLLDTVKFDH